MARSPRIAVRPVGPSPLRRHAWKLLLALVGIIGMFGIGDLFFGLDADPAITIGVTGLTPDEIRSASEPVGRLADLQVRSGALQLIVMSVLWGATVLVPFRNGERWAWYTLWSFPAWSLLVSVSFLLVPMHPGAPPPPPAISGWVFFSLSSLLLWAIRSDFAVSSDD